nr:type I-F CRISPR-associated protein Csy2 [Moritella viscosa]SHO17850.1 Putative uncharacterized protein [Moritella viscosa]
MNDIEALIQLPQDANKNKILRDAFWPATPCIDITSNPSFALIILINLTSKLTNNTDLLDEEACKEKLRDNIWWQHCLKTAEFRHTHNLKFPDYRTTGVIRLDPIEELPDYLFSSQKLNKKTFGYSQNSGDINLSIFLCSDFIWQGTTTSLALVLADSEHPLWELLQSLGCTAKNKLFASKQLSNIQPHSSSVNLSPNYLPQIRLPFTQGEYVSLTPVVSHMAQAIINNELNLFPHLTRFHHSSRAPNVGNLITAAGASIKQIGTPLKLRYTEHQHLKKQSQWMNKERFNALIELNRQQDWLTTSNRHKQLKQHYQSHVKLMVTQWVDDSDIQSDIPTSTLVQKLNVDLSTLRQGHRIAYQPILIQLFEQILSSIGLSTQLAVTNAEQNRYLLIPNIHVSNANAESSAYTVGIPSLMGFYGFIHAFERNLASKHALETNVNSFAICMHTYHLQKRGQTKEFVQYANGDIKSPGIVDGWQCDFTFSLVLKLEPMIDIDINAIISSLPKRLCRGNAHLKISDIDAITFQSSFSNTAQAIPSVQGQWLTPDVNIDLDSAVTLLEYCNKKKNNVLLCSGYHLLETPQNRENALDNNQHAFCEPIISTAQLVSVNNFRRV